LKNNKLLVIKNNDFSARNDSTNLQSQLLGKQREEDQEPRSVQAKLKRPYLKNKMQKQTGLGV
jgi:hypothetical protein